MGPHLTDQRRGGPRCRRRLDLRLVRLVLRPPRPRRPRLRHLPGGFPLRQYEARPRTLETRIRARRLGVDALRRRHQHRSHVLRRGRTGHDVPHPAEHRGRNGRRRSRIHRVGALPLRFERLGTLRPDGHGPGLLRLPDEHAAGDPFGAGSDLRQTRPRCSGRDGRLRRPARHDLRCGHLVGHRRRDGQRRPQHGSRDPDRHRHSGRHRRRRSRCRHALGSLRCRQGNQVPLHPQRRPRNRFEPVGARGRKHEVPAQRLGPQRHRLRSTVPEHGRADLRLRRHRNLDDRLDPVLLGLVDRLRLVRRALPRPHLPRAHHPPVRAGHLDDSVHLHLHVDLDLRKLGAGHHPQRRQEVRRVGHAQPRGRLL